MRVLHFSDIHIGMPLSDVPWSRWLSKRALGGAHLALGRGRLFDEAQHKVAALAELALDREVQLVLFTGDYTALGLDPEFERARISVSPLMGAPAGYVGLPGNHDFYVPQVVRARRFEHYWGDTLSTDLPDLRTDGAWPMVRLIGSDVAVVAVDSSRPNPPWRSTGRIREAQLEGLAAALTDGRVGDRFVFVATHYAPRLADGGPDRLLHRLDNAEAFLSAAAGLRRGAIVCGHVHHRFHLRLPNGGPHVFCAGSATLAGREGAWLFDVDAGRAAATPLCWRDGRWVADPGGPVEISNAPV